MAENMVREFITFSGDVQGVGFRYKMSHLARFYGVTGWVRNEYDGTVTAELQGRPENLDKIIQSLNQDSYIRLYDIDRRKRALEDDESGFRVLY